VVKEIARVSGSIVDAAAACHKPRSSGRSDYLTTGIREFGPLL